MKNLLEKSFLFVVLIVVTLTSCSKDDDPKPEEPELYKMVLTDAREWGNEKIHFEGDDWEVIPGKGIMFLDLQKEADKLPEVIEEDFEKTAWEFAVKHFPASFLDDKKVQLTFKDKEGKIKYIVEKQGTNYDPYKNN
ncbi:MAG: hypothetical protein N4A44_01975 [Alphaproteobacteria bacterium]|jgi:hypothetical protein|nr:hypothetical protein [Alphaproteobacteria bacterium]